VIDKTNLFIKTGSPPVSEGPHLLVHHHPHLLTIQLNRPHSINALTLDMIQDLQHTLDEAEKEDRIKMIILHGAGEKGFCAGGDLRALVAAVRIKNFTWVDQFFYQEYALDWRIHRFPKPVIVLADGITMGGGLGLAAGADIVLTTEHTRMAMPETQIGFFPDVGASRWLFDKCPKGYPEFLALTGYEMRGAECIRVGLATDLIEAGQLKELLQGLEKVTENLSRNKKEALRQLRNFLSPSVIQTIPARPEMDHWVATIFSGKDSVIRILTDLSQDLLPDQWSTEALQRLKERSPTAIVLTLSLLRTNEFRPLQDVFSIEARAAHFMVRQPDYLEGIRARLLDRDYQPRWEPPSIDQVPPLNIGEF
jgi:enoyl-CoA hydratase/carnithine racemase